MIWGAASAAVGGAAGFLELELAAGAPATLALTTLVVLAHPAFLEELVFRVLLLPRPRPGARAGLAAAPSLALYVVAHPLRAMAFDPHHVALFSTPTYLVLAAFLGAACTLAYQRTRSIWPAVFLHALAVDAWILLLGGWRRLG